MAVTHKEAIAQTIDLLEKRDDINLQMKALREAIANAGLNAKAIMAVAMAIKQENTEELEEYADGVSEVLTEYRK